MSCPFPPRSRRRNSLVTAVGTAAGGGSGGGSGGEGGGEGGDEGCGAIIDADTK